jgi:hypothetical protein
LYPGNGNIACARTKSAAACKTTHLLLNAAEDEEDEEGKKGGFGLAAAAAGTWAFECKCRSVTHSLILSSFFPSFLLPIKGISRSNRWTP